MINGSLALRHKIDCHLSGVVDGEADAFSLQERVDRLHAWNDAWRSGHVSETFTLSCSRIDAVSGNAVAQHRSREDFTSVHIVQIPSKYRGTMQNEWEISLKHLPHEPFQAIALDHSQRLLIVLGEYVMPYNIIYTSH